MEFLKRDMTQPTPVLAGMSGGAFHAVSGKTFAAPPPKPVRKRPCCKTCDGRACVGRCKF